MANTTTFTRSLAGQVIPDPTLHRRYNMPFSVGKPLPKSVVSTWMKAMKDAEQPGRVFETPPFPKGIYSVFGRNSLFNAIQMRIDMDRGKMKLLFSEPVYTISNEGTQSKAMRGFSFLSDAAKMGAPSFSLPAGPQREGGTCAAAGWRASSMVRPSKGNAPGASRTDAHGNLYVCDACYATSGNYWYATTTLAQAVRLRWCEQQLKTDPSGALLSEDFIHVLEKTAREATYDNLSERMGQEFGVWRNGQIVVPGLVKHRGVIEVPVLPTNLPPMSGFKDTFEFFRGVNPPEGSVTGFFRIHDSGDLNVGSKVATWKGYLRAWTLTARHFSSVLFWIPVRTWQNEEMKAALQEAAREAPNLVIRASPLFIDGDAPKIEGLAASAVHKNELRPHWYECPVGPSDDSSCTAVGCRACWMYKELIPSYKEH